MISMEQQLELQFKNDRNYLHGPDIFNNTLSWLSDQKSEIKDIDFSFHRLAVHQLKILAGATPEGIKPVAVCSFTSGGVRERIYLAETEQAVTGRKFDSKDVLFSGMAIDLTARRGVLHGKPIYSDIETWVAMTKELHCKVFSQSQGKWLFVRGRFSRYVHPYKADEIVLVIASSFNDKLTRSDVLLDDVKVGEIYFSIV